MRRSKSSRKRARRTSSSALGDLEGFQKGWELTSREAVKAMEGMADQAKRMARDFKALDKEAIPQGLKDFLIKEGPDAVDAFVHGTERQKNRFQAAWRTFESAQKDSIAAMERAARPAGTAMVQGIIKGVESGRAALSPPRRPRSSVKPSRRPRLPPARPPRRSGCMSSVWT